MNIRLYQKLTYRIVITRMISDNWPLLKVGKVSYDVSEAEAEVAVYMPDSPLAAPVFDVRPVYATQGRRLEEGSLPGGTMIGRHAWSGRQAQKFEQVALDEAKRAYRRFIDEEIERDKHIAR